MMRRIMPAIIIRTCVSQSGETSGFMAKRLLAATPEMPQSIQATLANMIPRK